MMTYLEYLWMDLKMGLIVFVVLLIILGIIKLINKARGVVDE